MRDLENLAKFIRFLILVSSAQAGSGHPTSSLSATDLMTVLFFGGFLKFDVENPKNPNNDRIIFSKGHATPLFYSLWKVAGVVSEEELMTYRKFGSRLEGHPSIDFSYVDVPTGSLGQGLSMGVGMAINSKYIDRSFYKTFVLLGDGEFSEGSNFEAMQIASHYKLNNLVGILDVNRLGQAGPTMLGWDTKAYAKRISSFGWQTIEIDGHNLAEIAKAYSLAESSEEKPVMILAKTIKGKGISFFEDKEGWHGKALDKEQLEKALKEIGAVDKDLLGKIREPLSSVSSEKKQTKREVSLTNYPKDIEISTRQAYGNALNKIFLNFPEMVVLDAEVKNSTFSETFEKENPERFFEMFIAEQNMAGVAEGLASRGKIVFASTFAAFWTRAHDQIRIAALAESNIKFVGSHAGVSIGADGPTQMGLEDIALFRSLTKSVVFYPSDAISTEKLVLEAAKYKGLVYFRTTRGKTPVIYGLSDKFEIGGSKILKKSQKDKIVVATAGITIFEALKAYEALKNENIYITIVDLYSIKPIDSKALIESTVDSKPILVVEDHYPEGGIGDAVREVVSEKGIKVYSLAVTKKPHSASSSEQLSYQELDSKGIVKRVKEILS